MPSPPTTVDGPFPVALGDLKPILPLYVDSTMISAFRACPRKFFYEFILGLRGAETSVHLHAGAVFASTLEAIYHKVHVLGMSDDEAICRSYLDFLAEWGDFTTTKPTPKTRENIWDAVWTYMETYPPRQDHIQPYFNDGHPTLEFTFSLPLFPEDGFPLHPSGSPFLYSGRFDMLGELDGHPVVRDEKTTGSIGSAWAEQWDLRSQFIGYCWACQQVGLPVDSVVVRGVGILKGSTTHVEAIKTYSHHLVEKWYEQLRRDLWRLVHAWDEGYFDLNLADACSSFGGCQFKLPCLSDNPTPWLETYTVRRWDPTKKNPALPAEGGPGLIAYDEPIILEGIEL